jgi:ribosomal protein S18 acetylase RimI-like enzyme
MNAADKKVFLTFFEALRENACPKRLVLHTPVNDERAIAFFHELGFEYAGA